MLSIFEAVTEILMMILIIGFCIYFLIKEIKDILKFHIYTWHMIFDKDKGLSRDINKIKTDFIKIKADFIKMRKSLKSQKKHREMWNKALGKKSK